MSNGVSPEVVDLMTGYAPDCSDQLPAAAENMIVRVLAGGLAVTALALSMGVGPGVPSPRLGESSTQQVAIQPEKRSNRNPNSGPISGTSHRKR